MKEICFINGSPRGNEGTSLSFLNKIKDNMNTNNYTSYFIDVKNSSKGQSKTENFEKMSNSDVIVISFPLYVYCLPGVLMRFLEDYYCFLKNKKEYKKDVKVYAIVNCGFPEPEINNEAIRVIKNFCDRLGLNWRFGIGIANGGYIGAIKDIPFLRILTRKVYGAIKEINKDIDSNEKIKKDMLFVKPLLPTPLYLAMGSTGWLKAAKDNGLAKVDIYRKPYIGN